ncbi:MULTISPECIES: NfeD family protein [unclassified Lentimonas]|uniref:NfeD family protein n=1 Tax=unclassified Lentimonas TaxID=2630993 RepID=UPI0013206546|nr:MULTISPECIES: NfeD family protein [unclassified Lentimonas]CAA6677874.1 Unannotated [Lentimonas sp. CC4]CAA6683978.1 Unannotated [Lentimonas sp. CC6]CAA7076646.1 Unannotated [Lentimonas sp. CC4]CAA7170026.1 Unannotated [Lentimonas sp. CC21]CAA7181309.1 Unannotated [Lentimonas sp. CC8]
MDEILIGLAAYSITMFLLWLLTHQDPQVSDNWKHPFGIFIRMAGLFCLLHLFLTSLPVEAWQAYSVVVFILAFPFIWQLYDCDFMVVGILCWLIYQWAFWFPAKEEVILKNESIQKKKTEVEGLPRYGFATTDLKPVGKVAIDGEERTAISTLGFVSSGDRVLIEGSNGMELRVRKLGPADSDPLMGDD